jgi:hypothetical protein
MNDVKAVARSIKALARRADIAARKLEFYRTSGIMIYGTSNAGLAQLGQAARDFANAVDSAFAALSPETRSMF